MNIDINEIMETWKSRRVEVENNYQPFDSITIETCGNLKDLKIGVPQRRLDHYCHSTFKKVYDHTQYNQGMASWSGDYCCMFDHFLTWMVYIVENSDNGLVLRNLSTGEHTYVNSISSAKELIRSKYI